MRWTSIKRTVIATALAAITAIGGLAGQAHALQFASGDAVLVLYGNNTEYYQNLGNFNTLLSTGVDLDAVINIAKWITGELGSTPHGHIANVPAGPPLVPVL